MPLTFCRCPVAPALDRGSRTKAFVLVHAHSSSSTCPLTANESPALSIRVPMRSRTREIGQKLERVSSLGGCPPVGRSKKTVEKLDQLHNQLGCLLPAARWSYPSHTTTLVQAASTIGRVMLMRQPALTGPRGHKFSTRPDGKLERCRPLLALNLSGLDWPVSESQWLRKTLLHGG